MAQGHLTTKSWEECEALRSELANSRCQLAVAADSLKHSLNARERARNFIRERPGAAMAATLAAGAFAARILPGFLWRSKGSLFGRFAGELMKGAAGMVLPVLASHFASRLRARRDPNTFVLRAP